ncbi:MAG TPA: DUF3352 domain-containing protein [Miltoncostaeaceae bacterium]|nr:DUF3352 domain-containing protein [Miltoncostaeaceae bacterium]
MAVKLSESLRRRRTVAILTAGVAASAIAVAGCGGGSETGSSAGDVASYVPSSSPLYLEVTTDFDGAQWQQVQALATEFPGYPQLERMIQKDLETGNVDFDTDVKPLLGERAAIAGLALPPAGDLTKGLTVPTAAEAGDDMRFVAVVDVADGKSQQVKDLLVREGAVSGGEHDGAEYFTSKDADGVVAVDDEALVFSDTKEQVFAALDAHQAGGDQTLAGTDKFTGALAKLPSDVFGQAYLDLGAFVQEAGKAAGPQADQLGLADLRNAVMAASIAAEPDGARLKGVIMGAPSDVATEFSPTLTETVPADALAYVGFSNLSGALTQVFQQVQGSLGDEEKRQLEGLSDQLPQLLGVSLDDLSALAEKEHALVVTPGATPGAALALQVDDGAKAQDTLDKLRVGIPALVKTFQPDATIPKWQPVPLAGGVQGWRLPLSPKAGVVYGVDGDLAIVGTSVRAVTSVQRPVASLSESAAFQEGTAGMPDQVTSVFWLNLQEGLGTLRKAGALKDATPATLANLRPLKSLAAWTTAGDVPGFEVFVRIHS